MELARTDISPTYKSGIVLPMADHSHSIDCGLTFVINALTPTMYVISEEQLYRNLAVEYNDMLSLR